MGRKNPDHSERMKKIYSEGKGTLIPPDKGSIPWNKGILWGEGRNSKGKNTIFRKLVKERDGKCLKCGSTERLHAHHIKPWKDYPELRFDINNGTTLCNSCHSKEEGFQKGHKVPKEWIVKANLKKIGRIPWNKGLKKVKNGNNTE